MWLNVRNLRSQFTFTIQGIIDVRELSVQMFIMFEGSTTSRWMGEPGTKYANESLLHDEATDQRSAEEHASSAANRYSHCSQYVQLRRI